MQKHAALYCRLSVDDGSFGGSVSIETQQILLTFWDSHGKIKVVHSCSKNYITYRGRKYERSEIQ